MKELEPRNESSEAPDVIIEMSQQSRFAVWKNFALHMFEQIGYI